MTLPRNPHAVGQVEGAVDGVDPVLIEEVAVPVRLPGTLHLREEDDAESGVVLVRHLLHREENLLGYANALQRAASRSKSHIGIFDVGNKSRRLPQGQRQVALRGVSDEPLSAFREPGKGNVDVTAPRETRHSREPLTRRHIAHLVVLHESVQDEPRLFQPG